MAYLPSAPPSSVELLAPWLQHELARLAESMQLAQDSQLMVYLHAAPVRVRPGMLVLCDGTEFDASGIGGGAGLYRRNEANTDWERVNSGVFPGDIVLPKTAGIGVQVDTESPTFGWRDILGLIDPKTTGANTPTLTAYAGGNVRQFAFVANDLIDFDYHIPHDYVPGTDVFVHVHWGHNGTSISGDAVFSIYAQYAKGHNQTIFGSEISTTITYATTDIATTPQYVHRIDEIALSSSGGSGSTLDTSLLEPDGLVLLQFKLTTLPTIGGGGKLFVHHIDLHYQSTNMATKQKAPDFYV